MHFFIGLGALISPLVADPFLTEDSCVLNTNWTPNYHHFRQNASDLDPISTYSLQTEGEGLSSVSYAFWIMALINVSPPASWRRMNARVRPEFHIPASAVQLPVPVAVFALMYQKRLLPCLRKGPALLGERSGSAPPDGGHGNAQQLAVRAAQTGRPPAQCPSLSRQRAGLLQRC